LLDHPVEELAIMRRLTWAVASVVFVGFPAVAAAQAQSRGQFEDQSATQFSAPSLQAADRFEFQSFAHSLDQQLSRSEEHPAGQPLSNSISASAPSAGAKKAATTIVVPAESTVQLALTAPLWSKDSGIGTSVYAQTVFPVVVNNRIAIPAGTYVEGQIDALTKPRIFWPRAQLQIDFHKLIFSSGYAVELPTLPVGAPRAEDVIAAEATAYVAVSSGSGLLLDNGSQIPMVLQLALVLDAARVAHALSEPNKLSLGRPQSSFCVPIPGTPATPDVVIPGTPGTPGTPPTVIPLGPGMPPTVIPGTPPTPGTPETVIPGSSGSPGVACPAAPVVVPHAKAQNYKEWFQLSVAADVGGVELPAGRYEITWTGLGGPARVQIGGRGISLAAEARVVLLWHKAPADDARTRTNAQGSVSLDSLRFAGQGFAVYFD
jgi:hypothetical protein